MRATALLAPTLREAPADAEVEATGYYCALVLSEVVAGCTTTCRFQCASLKIKRIVSGGNGPAGRTGNSLMPITAGGTLAGNRPLGCIRSGTISAERQA